MYLINACLVIFLYSGLVSAKNTFPGINLVKAKSLFVDTKQSNKSVQVAILDVSFFGHKLLIQNKFSENFNSPSSSMASPHGTSVAQVMASEEFGVFPEIEFGYFGVVEDVESLKAHLIEIQKRKIRLVNMSLNVRTAEAVTVLNEFIDQGGLVVNSAGNSAERLGVELPSYYKGYKGVLVSSMNENNVLSNFSNYCDQCVMAPGEIGKYETKYLDHRKFDKRLGEPSSEDLKAGRVKQIAHSFGQTSSAAPIVTAVFAMAMQIHPELSSAMLKNFLYMSVNKSDNNRNILDAYGFLKLVIESNGTSL